MASHKSVHIITSNVAEGCLCRGTLRLHTSKIKLKLQPYMHDENGDHCEKKKDSKVETEISHISLKAHYHQTQNKSSVKQQDIQKPEVFGCKRHSCKLK